MSLKTALIVITVFVLGIVFSSYLVGGVLLTNVTGPFSTIQRSDDSGTDGDPGIVTITSGDVTRRFATADIAEGWIPYIIKQLSILIGGISMIVFFYAGVNLIIKGDNEEEYAKSIKMIVFGVVGIALAALSYTFIANILVLFS